jgi:hypothetical protein
MALPTLAVTPGTGSSVNTLPSATAADPAAVPVALPLASTSASTAVAAAAASTQLLAANAARKRYTVTNDSSLVAYVLEGSGTVSATNYTYQIQPGGFYSTTEWSGAVKAIWASATGNAYITEYTA